MRLRDELKAIGCTVGEEEFKDGLADLFTMTNRDRTMDSLRCRWRDARDFCRIARQRMSLPETCDELIIRVLDNHRRTGALNVGFKETPRQISMVLKEHGIEVEADEFRKLIQASFRELYDGWTVDQLLNRWGDSGYFCAIVRARLKANESISADALILSELLNWRKKKSISA